jgi:transposase
LILREKAENLRILQAFLPATQRERLWLEFVPAYAPELNPLEYLWSHWKQHELPNFCPSIFAQLSVHGWPRQSWRPSALNNLWNPVRSYLCALDGNPAWLSGH